MKNIPRAALGLLVLGLAVIVAGAVFGKGYNYAAKGL